jgi:hypothetical protein
MTCEKEALAGLDMAAKLDRGVTAESCADRLGILGQ